MIDLRSDTITKPTAEMRDAMARAEVGDDVLGDDPTVKELEAEVAGIVGKEAALFVTSGTMSNQIAISLHTRPGDEVVIGEGAHVAFYESGASAALSGVQFAIAGRGGFFDVAEMEERIHPPAYWSPRTSLVCIENTHNRGGGRIFPQSDVIAVANAARMRGLGVHLDGARLWNASVATGISVRELAAPFDTVSVCFSKGLGAPVGSALCASREWVERGRRLRKMWGGGMRQSGILAAGAIHALRHHRDRLVDDHTNARLLAEKLAASAAVSVDLAGVRTNIVNVDLRGGLSADAVSKKALTLGLVISPSGPSRLRAVTHLGVTAADASRAAEILLEAATGVATT